MTVNFSLLALDQLVNTAATLLHMSGGQFNVPLVVRTTTGAGRQLAAQHSHSLEGWFAARPRSEGDRSGDARRCPMDAADRARRPEPGDHLRALRAVQRPRAGRPECWARRHRPRRRAPTRRRPDDRCLGGDGSQSPRRRRRTRRAGRVGRGDRPSLAAPARPAHDRRRRCSAPTAPSSSTKAGAPVG